MMGVRRTFLWLIYLRAGLFFSLLLLLVAGCASMGNTLAQDLAWERWQKCSDIPTVTLKEISPDGQIWFYYTSPMVMTAQECLRKAAEEQSRRVAVSPPPPTATGQPLASGPAVAPVWKPGYEWAFRWESPRGKGTFVWSVDREEIIEGVEYYVVKSGTTREIYWRKADLAYYMDKVEGVVETRHMPPSNWYAWPLSPGKTWELRYTEDKPVDRTTNELARTCRMEAEESITVPAGTFRTLKIVCRNARTGSITSERWYAPEVKHWIRERTHFSYGIRERELIALKLK